MKGPGYHIPSKLAVLAAVIATLALGGCSNGSSEGFAIYLTENDIPPSRMEALSHVVLQENPLVSMDDIVSYNANTHEISLTADASERISKLEVPTSGKSFMVCINGGPIYWGAFWTPISSQSFDGVTIWMPLGFRGENTIKLELGYPSSSFYGGEDPRNNTEIMDVLDRAGKLTTAAITGNLPHSLKGYGLYS